MKDKFTRFLVLKIIGCVGIAIAVAGIVIYIVNLGNEFSTGLFIAGLLMMILGILSGVPCLFFGFLPRLLEARVATMQRLQQQNIHIIKELSAAAAQASADMQAASSAPNDSAKAPAQEASTENEFKNESNKMYCKHCGIQIDSDSKFCKACGKEL